MVQEELSNDLVQYRKRMRFTQLEVIRLLGWKNIKGLALLESGQRIPTLITALKLGIIYRIPTDFLYRELYEQLRSELRAKELVQAPPGQQPLPLTHSATSTNPLIKKSSFYL